MRIARPGLVLALTCLALASPQAAPQPNIFWIVAEDLSPMLGCFGDPRASTPNIDHLASRGLRYTKCWSTAPVCAPARTALISGVYPTSTGGEHMRSQVALPSFIRTYPELLRQAGYYCVNKSKEDYNLALPAKIWDESSPKAHYRNRQPGQPFFAAFNIELTHESQIRSRPHTLSHDPTNVRLPAYHPDTPEVRHDWAQVYDKIKAMDTVVGQHLRELEELGLAEDTIVFFYGDNGCGMPRGKRWPYNSGLNVPLVIFVPDKFKPLAPKGYQPGATNERLLGFVDFAPTLLSLAGVKPPEWMQGSAFMGPYEGPATKYAYGFRGRMDERYDMVRSVRNDRYVYIRNYLPHLIYGQYLEYMFQTPTTRVWKELYDQGKLSGPQKFFWQPKPAEELYDLQTDPDEVTNLVQSPEHKALLEELRQAERGHALKTRDAGFLPEAELHSRAKGSTIYEMAHDSAKYPVQRILEAADLASRPASDDLPRLKEALADPDSAVRYWAAMGFRIRGRAAVQAAQELLTKALKDESASVRIAAAGALGTCGLPDDKPAVYATLKELLSPEKNGAYASLMALNVIDQLGLPPPDILATLRGMPTTDPNAPARANSYVPRMVAYLTGDKAPAESAVGAKASQRKNAKKRATKGPN